MFAARAAYVLLILSATLAELAYDPDPARVASRLARMLHPRLVWSEAADALRNLAIFAGFGAVWVATSTSGRVWRSTRVATLAGFLLSAFVEIAQLVSARRQSSLVDVATNTLGTLGGALLVIVLAALVRGARGRKSFVGIPAFLFAVPYAAAVFLEAFTPLLRRTVSYGIEGGALQRIGLALSRAQGVSWDTLPLSEILIFFPAGALAVAALVEGGDSYRTALRRVLVGGVVLAALAELAHGPIRQPFSIGALIVHVVAIALGAVACARTLPRLTAALRGRARPLALLVAYALVLALWAWRPYYPKSGLSEIAAQLTREHLVPLVALREEQDVFTVSKVGELFSLFLPVGALLAVWPVRRFGWLAGLWPVVYLTLALQLGQLLAAERFLDVTDILIALAAATLGWIVVRRSGFRPYGELLPPYRQRASREGAGRAGRARAAR